jgi:hypothetical protein
MQEFLPVLAVLGVLAVISRAARAVFSLLRGGVDIFLARDLHDVHAQRGDLTGMQEAQELRRTGRRRRALATARLLFWIGLLIVPGYTEWPSQLRAACCIFWVIPPRRNRGPTVRTQVRVSTR